MRWTFENGKVLEKDEQEEAVHALDLWWERLSKQPINSKQDANKNESS